VQTMKQWNLQTGFLRDVRRTERPSQEMAVSLSSSPLGMLSGKSPTGLFIHLGMHMLNFLV
jgi:hypothetical protein